MDLNSLILSCVSAGQALLEIPTSFSESEEDGSSSENEIILIVTRKRKLYTPQRIENYVEQIVAGYTAKQFQQNFRLTIEAYEHLLTIIGPQLIRQAPAGRPTVNVEKQLLATIWLLATPDSYRSVGERFNLAKSSLSVCFMRVVKILNALAPRIIKWPEGQRLLAVRRKFYTIARLDNVIGAVDGSFVPIKAPQEDPQSYITRKCNYAFTLQAIADPFLKFTDIFIGYPGSVSDTRIFKNSRFYHAVRNNMLLYFPEDDFILGDKAYPVLPWCIPPYINRGHLTQAKIYFNTVHAQTRQVVERAFALLFGRFRRFRLLDMNCTDKIPAAVLAASVLHNICLSFEDLLVEEYIQEGLMHVAHNEEDHNEPQHIVEEGRIRRDAICRQIYANRNIHMQN